MRIYRIEQRNAMGWKVVASFPRYTLAYRAFRVLCASQTEAYRLIVAKRRVANLQDAAVTTQNP